jgi:hypothetical protein
MASVPAGTHVFIVDNVTIASVHHTVICAKFNATLIKIGKVTAVMGSALNLRRRVLQAVGRCDENRPSIQGPRVCDVFAAHLAGKSSGSSTEPFFFKRLYQTCSHVSAARQHGKSGHFMLDQGHFAQGLVNVAQL